MHKMLPFYIMSSSCEKRYQLSPRIRVQKQHLISLQRNILTDPPSRCLLMHVHKLFASQSSSLEYECSTVSAHYLNLTV